MSHNVETMAYVGETPWHGLGTRLSEGLSLEEWQRESGLNWTVQKSNVLFKTPWNGDTVYEREVPGKVVLFRDKDLKPLGVVSSNRYHIVQPKDVLEFYRQFTETMGFTLETAGSLKEGRLIWALANAHRSLDVKGDEVKQYVLLSTSYDGTQATIAQNTAIRVVCNNTLNISISSASYINIPHSREFNPDMVKDRLGLGLGFSVKEETLLKRMASVGVDPAWVRSYFENIYLPLDVSEEDRKDSSRVQELVQIYNGGAPGQPESFGTVYGALNAVTYYQDHIARAKSRDSRLSSAWFGAGNRFKRKAFDLALRSV